MQQFKKIPYEYLEQNDKGNLNLGFNLKQFIQQIPPFSPSFISTHQLILTENYESELMADIFRFASLPRNKEELIKFGDAELEELIRFYEKSYSSNYPIPIIDSENIRNEWYLFKEIIY
ncbi:17582_t:CDS:2 [Funneliformis geosporum]|uniref:18324_t:CDS:1 n=1 Tax=Funneliformis geosporum TaxID=1117311 RepID=A0A9W4SU36_9GLOM|nr:18324_t:CDS:2 [Funneliformis geosporum]CAI2181718.1 17582_t:CDS:2 [Funneliformis geosporum]